MSKEKKVMRSDEAMVMLLDKLVTEVSDLKAQGQETLELVKKQIPLGMSEPIPSQTATTTPQTYQLRHKWFSLAIVNDGPQDCWIIVNTGKSSTTPYLLGVDEVYEIDMGSAQIYDIYFYTDTGTAVLRIRGVR